MRYIELTRGKLAAVDDADYEALSQFKWYYDNGYASRMIMVGKKQKVHLMHREILKTPKGLHSDHINGDTLDNQRSNLRLATCAQNAQNRAKRAKTSSRFKGVCWAKPRRGFVGGWVARIRSVGILTHLGYFKTEEAAAAAYNLAAVAAFGAFSRLNNINALAEEFPEDGPR